MCFNYEKRFVIYSSPTTDQQLQTNHKTHRGWPSVVRRFDETGGGQGGNREDVCQATQRLGQEVEPPYRER